MWKIYKSAKDGTLGKQEFLKELRTRLIQGKIKIEEVEKITAEYYDHYPREVKEPEQAQINK